MTVVEHLPNRQHLQCFGEHSMGNKECMDCCMPFLYLPLPPHMGFCKSLSDRSNRGSWMFHRELKQQTKKPQTIMWWRAQQWQHSSKVLGCSKWGLAQMQQPRAQKRRKESAYLWKASGTWRSWARYPSLHCQPLNEVWEGRDPGSTPSSPSGTLHAVELHWVGPAFPPGAQTQIQAVTQHFCCTDTF